MYAAASMPLPVPPSATITTSPNPGITWSVVPSGRGSFDPHSHSTGAQGQVARFSVSTSMPATSAGSSRGRWNPSVRCRNGTGGGGGGSVGAGGGGGGGGRPVPVSAGAQVAGRWAEPRGGARPGRPPGPPGTDSHQ